MPLKPGSIVEARVYSTTVEFRHHGSRIASHERCYGRLQKIFDLEHYLDVLDRKPGALRGSLRTDGWQSQRLAVLSDTCDLEAHACTACSSRSYSIMVGSGRSYADRAPISIGSPAVCCN